MSTTRLNVVPPPTEAEPGGFRRDVERVAAALRGLQFGAVTVIVQDGVVVQLERTEKIRVTRRAEA